MEALECNREELQILLNLLGERIRVEYPLYGFPLFEAIAGREGYSFTAKCSREEFDLVRGVLGDFARRELPDYSDLVLCALNAGVERYQNLQEFIEYREALSRMKSPPSFVPDANLFYHGFLSKAGIEPSRIVVIDLTKSEIESALNSKYQPSQLMDLKREVVHQRALLDALTNRRTKKARTAGYLALEEFGRLRGMARYVQSGEAPSSDREENDRILVRAVKRLGREDYSFPVLLTADLNMGDLCELEGIEYFVLKVPYRIESDRCTFGEMIHFLFNLATVFGFIFCNNVIIFGEFGGKGSDTRMLNLQFGNRRLQETFARDRDTCRALSRLGIEV